MATTARAGDLAALPKFLFAVAVITALCLLCAPLFVEQIDRAAPNPAAGVVDFSAHPLTGPTPLEGEWKLTWLSGAPGPPATSERNVAMPGRWVTAGLPGKGAASYRLTIHGVKPGRYVLHVPTIHAASRVTVNGRVLSEEGIAGLSQATSEPSVRAHDVTIDADGGPLDVRLNISSFDQWDNRAEAAPLFGPAKAMNRWIALHWLRGMLLLTSLLVLACYGLIIFAFRRRERVWAWFGLACLAMIPVMGVFAHDNMMLLAAPGMSMLTMREVEYLTVCIAMAALVAYTDQLFPRESPRTGFWILEGAVAANFIAYAVAGPIGGTMALSLVSYWSLWVRLGVMLYVTFIVGWATLRRRSGAAVYLLGMAFFFGAMIYTDFTAAGFLP